MGQRDLPVVGGVGAGITNTAMAVEILREARKAARVPPVIRLYEAARDIGGRISSYRFGDHFYDKGAHWGHRGKKNRIYRYLAKNHPAHIKPGAVVLDRLPSVMTVESKGHLTESIRTRANQILENAYWELPKKMRKRDLSVVDLASLTGDKRVVNWVTFAGCTWAGIEPRHLSSLEMYGGDPASSGGVQFTGGFTRPLAAINARLAEVGVEFVVDTRIKAISERNGACMVVDQKGQTEYINRLNVTVSIGVLKDAIEHGTINFKPSDTLVSYLGGLTMAHMSKLTAFYPEDYMRVQNIETNGRIYFERNGLVGFVHERCAGNPSLTLYFGGPCAVDVEREVSRNPAAGASIMDEVLNYVGKYPAQESHRFATQLSGFNLHPDFRGSYSAAVTGGRRGGPIRDGNTFYSGEAFVPLEKSPGTAEAAWWSGKQVGKEIFRELEPHLPRVADNRRYTRGSRQAALVVPNGIG